MDFLTRFKKLELSKISYSPIKLLAWYIFSLLGNTFFKKYPPKPSNGLKLLNLGAGAVKPLNFINGDFYRLHKIFSKDKNDWFLDITKPIKCKSDYWDGIILEHTNEHISYSENYFLMKELYRILKPGGVLRMVIPDLDKYLEWKLNQNDSPKMNRYASLPEAISNLAQNHLHKSIWNYDLMEELMYEVEFVDVQRCSFGKGRFNELIIDSPNHEWQSFYIEGIKKA